MRYHLTLSRTVIIKKNLQTIDAGDGMKKREPSHTLGENVK